MPPDSSRWVRLLRAVKSALTATGLSMPDEARAAEGGLLTDALTDQPLHQQGRKDDLLGTH
ncbi:hypothetical protein RD1_2458 [Roseobacter denitrificans OCh 114]|uniref:Uncharacterized protein n=1 Tax=Roseobacter denitrificans (strain ATCC 33942 / OCh 114) TaxID=375451 RepID=Q166R9_ROSDO|nr:hypothetical protein RD1_2458 [Roseobacter denitrificans OCh 114]